MLHERDNAVNNALLVHEVIFENYAENKVNSVDCIVQNRERSITFVFFFLSKRRHTRYWRDWSSDVCSSDLAPVDEGQDSGPEACRHGHAVGSVAVEQAGGGSVEGNLAPVDEGDRHLLAIGGGSEQADRKSVV